MVLRVTGHDEGFYPEPHTLEVGWETTVRLDERVDIDQLVDELESILVPHPFMLDQKWSHFSWGADGAGIQFVIAVASGTAVLAIDRLLKVAARLRKKGQASERPSRDEVIGVARRFLANARAVSEEGVEVEAFEEVRSGFRAVLVAQDEAYTVETDDQGSVYRLSKGKPKP